MHVKQIISFLSYALVESGADIYFCTRNAVVPDLANSHLDGTETNLITKVLPDYVVYIYLIADSNIFQECCNDCNLLTVSCSSNSHELILMVDTNLYLQ